MTEKQEQGPLGATDRLRWHLDKEQRWRYRVAGGAEGKTELEVQQDQTEETRYWLGLDLEERDLEGPSATPGEAASRALRFVDRILSPYDGRLASEFDGPLFITAAFVIAYYITDTPIPNSHQIEMARFLANVQRAGGPGDEGWGLHIEGSSNAFCTGLNYVAMRLLGVDATDPGLVRTRATLHSLGGATHMPSWGKFFLALLGVYDWRGVNAVPPEIAFLPGAIHPRNYWVHTRETHAPMSYLATKRFTPKCDRLILALRQEVFIQPYDSIRWELTRNLIAPTDFVYRRPLWANMLNQVVATIDQYTPSALREAGLLHSYRMVEMIDENSAFNSANPIARCLNMLCRFEREGPSSPNFLRHTDITYNEMWMGPRGLFVSTMTGSQCWDLTLLCIGVLQSKQHTVSIDRLRQWLEWLAACQITEELPWAEECHSHPARGGWPLATKATGLPVSDCTAEALKAVLLLQDIPDLPKLVSEERLQMAVDFLLSLQNPDGGFASYEKVRASGAWLEKLNACEILGNVMVEYCYVECTSSVVTALHAFQARYPNYRAHEIRDSIKSSLRYIHSVQLPDGSWYGSWGVCFTYATRFALEALALEGESYINSDPVRRACHFLLAHQMADGGWGEDVKGCLSRSYVPSATSQVTQTSWALLALLEAKFPDMNAIKRACNVLMSKQQSDGSWKQEGIEGAGNGACGMSYPSYKFTFGIWALGRAQEVLEEM